MTGFSLCLISATYLPRTSGKLLDLSSYICGMGTVLIQSEDSYVWLLTHWHVLVPVSHDWLLLFGLASWVEKNSFGIIAVFLHLIIIDSGVSRGSPVPCSMFSSVPHLHPRDASGTHPPPVMTRKKSPNIVRCPPRGRITPFQTPCVRGVC